MIYKIYIIYLKFKKKIYIYIHYQKKGFNFGKLKLMLYKQICSALDWGPNNWF